AVLLAYCKFLQTCLDFVIVAFAIFMGVKVINKLHKEHAKAPAAPTAEVVLLTEIRDLLKTENAPVPPTVDKQQPL
ncbi:MscL family protein, partial [Pseudomonas viridiflava]|uniref:MscL family protein n=1 Tax=Pseudomonas viridiflava TaxID=33069 RepID=UPI0019CFE443